MFNLRLSQKTNALLINQDRDIAIFRDNLKPRIKKVKDEGILIGYNLMIGDILLGTFDNIYEARLEKYRASTATGKYYINVY